MCLDHSEIRLSKSFDSHARLLVYDTLLQPCVGSSECGKFPRHKQACNFNPMPLAVGFAQVHHLNQALLAALPSLRHFKWLSLFNGKVQGPFLLINIQITVTRFAVL